jgi:peptidoglycan/LPS O-acetylase OafA/YrhL
MVQRSFSLSLSMSLILDIVRFGAAGLVILHHAAFEKFGAYVPMRLAQTATEPVMAFFVLSGFVIAIAVEAKDGTAYDYVLSRAARLLSVAIPALVLTVVLDFAGSAMFPALYSDHWSDEATIVNLSAPLSIQLAATATFVNEIWTLHLWPGTNSPFWSLGYEAAYYVIFGIAFYERGPWRRAIGVGGVCLAAGPKILLLLPVWLMGVWAWRIYKRAPIPPFAGAALCAVSVLAYIVFMASGARALLDHGTDMLTTGLPANLLGLSNHFLSNYVSGMLFAGTLIGFKGLEGTFAPALSVAAPWIRAAAGCTFSMYLFHYPLLYFFRAVASVLQGQQDLATRSWLVTGIVLIGTGAAIYLLARVTEQRKTEVRALMTAAVMAFRPSKIA